jgi:hypothetical protein
MSGRVRLGVLLSRKALSREAPKLPRGDVGRSDYRFQQPDVVVCTSASPKIEGTVSPTACRATCLALRAGAEELAGSLKDRLRRSVGKVREGVQIF